MNQYKKISLRTGVFLGGKYKSGLSFGLISQESISGVMTKTGDFFRSMFAAVPSFDEVKEFSSQAFEATKTVFKISNFSKNFQIFLIFHI